MASSLAARSAQYEEGERDALILLPPPWDADNMRVFSSAALPSHRPIVMPVIQSVPTRILSRVFTLYKALPLLLNAVSERGFFAAASQQLVSHSAWRRSRKTLLSDPIVGTGTAAYRFSIFL